MQPNTLCKSNLSSNYFPGDRYGFSVFGALFTRRRTRALLVSFSVNFPSFADRCRSSKTPLLMPRPKLFRASATLRRYTRVPRVSSNFHIANIFGKVLSSLFKNYEQLVVCILVRIIIF